MILLWSMDGGDASADPHSHGFGWEPRSMPLAAQLTGTLTKRSTIIGTPMWMSPEMVEAGQYDHVTDIWCAARRAALFSSMLTFTRGHNILILIPSL